MKTCEEYVIKELEDYKKENELLNKVVEEQSQRIKNIEEKLLFTQKIDKELFKNNIETNLETLQREWEMKVSKERDYGSKKDIIAIGFLKEIR